MITKVRMGREETTLMVLVFCARRDRFGILRVVVDAGRVYDAEFTVTAIALLLEEANVRVAV